MKAKFSYTSLHEYLDEQFAHLTYVSDEMVKKAKHEYRLLYNRWYKQGYRERMVEVSCSITKKQRQEIIQQAERLGLGLGKYIKARILNHAESNIQNLRIEVAKVIDMIEEYSYEKGIDMRVIVEGLEQLQTIMK